MLRRFPDGPSRFRQTATGGGLPESTAQRGPSFSFVRLGRENKESVSVGQPVYLAGGDRKKGGAKRLFPPKKPFVAPGVGANRAGTRLFQGLSAWLNTRPATARSRDSPEIVPILCGVPSWHGIADSATPYSARVLQFGACTCGVPPALRRRLLRLEPKQTEPTSHSRPGTPPFAWLFYRYDFGHDRMPKID